MTATPPHEPTDETPHVDDVTLRGVVELDASQFRDVNVRLVRLGWQIDALRSELAESSRQQSQRLDTHESRIAVLESLNVDVVEEAIWRVLRQVFNRHRVDTYTRRAIYVLAMIVSLLIALYHAWPL